MSAKNIARLFGILATVVVLAALVWRFAYNTTYFYYSLGAAILIAALALFIIYRKPREASKVTQLQPSPTGLPEKLADDPGKTRTTAADGRNLTDAQGKRNNPPTERVKPVPPKPDAVDVAAWYRQLAQKTANNNDDQPFWKVSPKPVQKPEPPPVKDPNIQEADGTQLQEEIEELTSAASPAEPSMPFTEDETTLTQDEKNELVNAVWCRCENPYCKYTSFLGVHHIVEEKNGGSNRLDNLIVLCPYCHDLAHRNEIPEKEMREWISDRAERLKYQPKWRYV